METPVDFDMWVHKLSAPLLGFLRGSMSGWLRELETASELAQSTWREALGSTLEIRSTQQFRAWLFTLATRKMIEKHRYHRRARRDARRRTAGEAPDDLAAPDGTVLESVTRREQLDLVFEATEGLPAQDQEILILAYSGCLPHREIAESLGISVTASRSRLFVAVSRLRDALRRAGGDPDLFAAR